MAVEGSMMREVFEAYLENILAPSLWPGQIMVDNGPKYKTTRASVPRPANRGRYPACRIDQSLRKA